MLTRFIAPADRQRLEARFERELERDVRLLLFVQPPTGLYIPGREEPQTGRQTQQLLQEVESLSPKLHLEVHNPRLEPELAQRFQIDRSPALILLPEASDGTSPPGSLSRGEGADEGLAAEGEAPAGPQPSVGGLVRFFGMPSGYEFASLIEDLVDVSGGRTRLSEATRQALAALAAPLHLQVFVTPTWPHCPAVARLAHQMAMESDRVTADVIEANEFPGLSARYAVQAVPKTVVNDRVEFLGAVNEARFLQEALRALPSD